MFEQTFKNIDDIPHKEAGCTTEQTSWILFLKYLDDLEQEKALEAELVGKPYQFIVDEKHSWSSWAVPKIIDRKVDNNTALMGTGLIDYVDSEPFLYLKGFKKMLDFESGKQVTVGANA